MKQWTDKEKADLKHLRLTEHKTVSELAVIFGRTTVSINNQLSEMKVKRPRKKVEYKDYEGTGCGYTRFPDSIRLLLGFPDYDSTLNHNFGGLE